MNVSTSLTTILQRSALVLVAAAGCGDDSAGTSFTGSATEAMTTTTTTATTDMSGTATESTTQDPSGSESDAMTTSTTSTSDPSTTIDPPMGICGDGALDDGEECDDGEANGDTKACTSACKAAACGDALVQEGVEQCDDGNAENNDACLDTCEDASCGDGFVQEGVEACDDGNDDDADECSNACSLASCGDGVVQVGEACDDGDMIDTNACTNMCMDASCGDAIIYEGVEACDDGPDNGDTKACTSACEVAVCGDSLVHEGVEACDDGNDVNTDTCTNMCEAPKCGDGFVQAGEECDDGNNNSNDGCSADCKSEGKLIFVSSLMYDGNLGGLAGADSKCQTLAQAAGLSGTFMAWISNNQGSPSTRFTKSNQPYRRVDGVVVANNYNDLVDGSLAAPINKTEKNGAPPVGNTSCAGGGFQTVWSATNTNGAWNNAVACNHWTSTAGGSYWGRADAQDGSWTSWCSGGLCSWLSPIYCVQQ